MAQSLKKVVLGVSLLFMAACSKNLGYDGADGLGASKELIAEFKNTAGDTVHFAFDSSELSAEAKSIVEKQAEFFKSKGKLRVVIEGHCDERGDSSYNLGLGERRANSVLKFLSHNGVDTSTLTVISYGKERPAAEGHDEAAWQQNRRAVTVIEAAAE